MLFGLILIIMMIYRPAGLIPAERRKRELKQSVIDEADGVDTGPDQEGMAGRKLDAALPEEENS